jgi:hypothetical protein
MEDVMMKNAALRFWPLATALALAASGLLSSCSHLLPSEPTATWTPLPTATPTATLTLTPTLHFTQWPLVVSEYFDEEKDDWKVGEINNDFVKGQVAVIGGKYYVKLTAKKPVYWYTIPAMKLLSDVYASVKVDQLGGSKTAESGIIVRGSESVQYFFSISALQQVYDFQKKSGDTQDILTLWTRTSRIFVAEPNWIAVKAEGSKFNLFINGEMVDDAVDSDSASGQVGIGIVLYKAGDWIEMTFDNFEVRSPE